MALGNTTLEEKLAAIVEPTLTHMGFELVRVAVLGRDHPTVQIMADRADGQLIGIEDCEAISHVLGAVLDVENPMTSAWRLEISSAGIDRPLTRVKDWNRFSGHMARVELDAPVAGIRRLNAIILSANAEQVSLRLDSGEEMAIPLASIRRAKLVLTDALIEATAPSARPH